MLVTSETWNERLGRWLPITSEVADRDVAAEARHLEEFLATCDEDERADYFSSLGVELGSS